MHQLFARLTVTSDNQILFFCSISAVFCVFVLIYVCYYLVLWKNSRHWVLVEAKVLFFSKGIDPYEGNFRKNVSYEYFFGGDKFVSSSFQLGRHRQRPFKAAIYNKLRDVKFSVYVDPKNPRQSSINIDLDFWGVVYLLFLAVLLLVPGIIVLHA